MKTDRVAPGGCPPLARWISRGFAHFRRKQPRFGTGPKSPRMKRLPAPGWRKGWSRSALFAPPLEEALFLTGRSWRARSWTTWPSSFRS